MAHFAELNQLNEVVRVIVVHNNELLDENQQESEAKGVAFCKSIFGSDTVWVQTSYNGSFRKNFASTDMIYDAEHDMFRTKQPYPSWILDLETGSWQPPVEIPMDNVPQSTYDMLGPESGNVYAWDESIQNWKKLT